MPKDRKSKPIKKVKRSKHEVKTVETKSSVSWKFVSVLLAFLLVLSFLTHGFRFNAVDRARSDIEFLLKMQNDDNKKTALQNALDELKEEPEDNVQTNKVKLVVLNDKECAECQVATQLVDQLGSVVPDMDVVYYDFEDSKGREIYDSTGLVALPMFLFSQDVTGSSGYGQIQQYLEEAGDYLSLRVGSTYNPLGEICDNSKDDRDQDGLVDCEDDECSYEWKCMEKKEVPTVELFVMSHCPYGTQMEKGILPVVGLLGDNIDFEVKFVYYAMHGEVEVWEQASQYCIQRDQKDLYLDYLTCFLEDGDSERCILETGVDTGKLDSCVEEIDSQFDIAANYADQSSWLSGRYPLFNTNLEDNEKYGVGGSPTLVINGVTASVGRDPASLLDAICTGFSEKPEECDKVLPSTGFNPGFGFDESETQTLAQCG